ncbi:hypothetical protein [Streptomyces syringium]|uniref:hypothetical protein n=1 Tax=Streptomyces syringium TaxID=76729 RepID=UPI003AAC7A48
MKVRVIACTAADALHCRYAGESQAQPAYVELGLKDGVLLASYDSEVGGAVPSEVYHGIDLRWPVPVLGGTAATRLLERLEPLAQRILDDSEITWNGSNRVGVLGEDGQAAAEEIEALCEAEFEDGDANPDLLPVWSVDTLGDLWDADEAGIGACTTDEELDVITARLLEEFRQGMGQPDAVIDGLGEYLRSLRDDLAADAA